MKIGNIATRAAKGIVNVAEVTGKKAHDITSSCVKSLKSGKDKFIKNKTVNDSINKDTVTGAAIIAAAATAVVKGVKAGVEKIKDMKKD
ncbi:hypothetical protein IJX73_00180 [bacterium]|nr:hypothetical protein [bacterium]